MKRKPCQAPFKLPRPGKAIGAGILAAIVLILAPIYSHAQSNNSLICTTACPECCSNPDTLLRQQFRGPSVVPLKKPLDVWYIEDFWPRISQKIISATNQINAAIMTEATRRASLIDAQNHVRSITSLQKGSAKASSHYLGSESMCRFATLSQGLSATEGQANAIKQAMIKRSFDRQFLVSGGSSADNTVGKDGKAGTVQGQSADKNARWGQYLTTFCNPGDYGQGKAPSGVCKTTSDAQYNKDINFTATLGDPQTIAISGTASTKDSQNLDALADNLYGHDLVNNMPKGNQLDPNAEGNEANIRKYMLLRSVIAKRSIAENSFTSLAAMKAAGTTASAKFTQNLMIELGIPKAQAEKFVGDNPSYYAQMEALTRKMYESPTFYSNLMEGPINVKRQQAAMKSLELMQQRDIYKSLQRSELLMSTLLDIYVSREQGGVDKKRVQSE